MPTLLRRLTTPGPASRPLSLDINNTQDFAERTFDNVIDLSELGTESELYISFGTKFSTSVTSGSISLFDSSDNELHIASNFTIASTWTRINSQLSTWTDVTGNFDRTKLNRVRVGWSTASGNTWQTTGVAVFDDLLIYTDNADFNFSIPMTRLDSNAEFIYNGADVGAVRADLRRIGTRGMTVIPLVGRYYPAHQTTTSAETVRVWYVRHKFPSKTAETINDYNIFGVYVFGPVAEKVKAGSGTLYKFSCRASEAG